jgi:hypothetical protein
MQNGFKLPHEYSQLTPSSSRYSPPDSPRTLPSVFDSSDRMSSHHRGLPPPVGMQLPPPERQPSVMGASLGALPAPPSQWQGQDHPDSMRNWLTAKAEEDRRKQEEEKTRQETMRLDQRKIEQSMLRESLQGGIPPVMVPLIFAGMGGGALPAQTLEWAQHYMAQMTIQNQQQQAQLAQEQQQRVQQQQAQQQQQQLPPSQHMSPDVRRDNRMIPPNPYGGHQPLQPAPQPAQQLPQLPPPQRQQSTILSGPTSAPRPSTSSSNLARLNTTETNAQIQQQHHDIQPQIGNQSLIQPHPLQPAQSQQQQQQDPQPSASGTAPGLFFHHWTPPTNSNGIQPPTPSGGKSAQSSPYGIAQATTHSHLRSEYQSSPKKRKQGPGGGQRHNSRDRSSPRGSERSRSREQGGGGGRGASRENVKRRQSRNSLSESSEQYPRPSSAQRRHEQQDAQRRRSGSSSQGLGRNREEYEREASRGVSEMRPKEEGMDVD